MVRVVRVVPAVLQAAVRRDRAEVEREQRAVEPRRPLPSVGVDHIDRGRLGEEAVRVSGRNRVTTHVEEGRGLLIQGEPARRDLAKDLQRIAVDRVAVHTGLGDLLPLAHDHRGAEAVLLAWTLVHCSFEEGEGLHLGLARVEGGLRQGEDDQAPMGSQEQNWSGWRWGMEK